ncbi:hypothetical protein [Microbacterium sp. SD291]|uniref:hypothetical protein n=1 Tax=Microbacterium sp. SD291 TaxID=2782007 RepID=UPI001A9622EF|nr:hypothetical protein [Microbacterium sp. SD291]MBO0979768.1 hypothetical protein [Microbacterium sp. SD291]
MLRRNPLPDSLTPHAFRFDDAVGAGIARSRLRADDIVHAHHGVYGQRTDAENLLDRCLRLALVFDGSCAFSHLTAARLWGIPLPFRWTPEEPLHAIADAGAAPVRRPGVIGWETGDELGRTVHLGVPIMQPAEVWCQLAMPGATGTDESGRRRSLSSAWLVAVGDYLLTGPKVDGIRVPLCTREHLIAALARHKGKRGVRNARAAIDRMRAPVHSPRETLLRLALVDHGLPEPEVQLEVLTADGIRHGDLGYRKARLLIEYQGDHHRTDRAQWLEDLTRTQLFEDAGYRVILAGAADLEPSGIRSLAERIRRALRARDFGG